MARIVLAIFAILLAHTAAIRPYEIPYLDITDNRLLGTKTPYENVGAPYRYYRLEADCRTEGVWMLARHGTQYPDKEFISQVPKLMSLRDKIINETARSGRLNNENVESFRNWMPHSNMTEEMATYLTPRGEEEMSMIIQNFQRQLPDIFPNKPQFYKFRSSNSQAARASMEYFMDSLLGSKNAVPVEESPARDTLLSAHENCPKWNSSVEKSRVESEAKKFIAGPEYQSVITNVVRKLGFNDSINSNTIQLMFDMCRYEVAWGSTTSSPWCTLFEDDDFRILLYLEDLYYYYYSGPGRDINVQLASNLLKDMLNHLEKLDQGNFNNEPNNVIYFTDTVAVQTLLAALKIKYDSTPLQADNFKSMYNRKFYTSILGAFASNFAAVFRSCTTHSENYISFYLNQGPVKISDDTYTAYELKELKSRLNITVDDRYLHCLNSATTHPIYVFFIALALIVVASLNL